jgi:hypothetical protein
MIGASFPGWRVSTDPGITNNSELTEQRVAAGNFDLARRGF